MPGKRLFWIAIIIVELVFVYVLWRPIRAHWKPTQRAAITNPAVRQPEARQPEARPQETLQPNRRQAEIHEPGVHGPEAPKAPQSEAHKSLLPPQRIPSGAVTAAGHKPSQPLASTPRKPSGAIAKSNAAPRKRVVINAGLKTPEPIPPKPTPPTPRPSGPLDSSFWCNISHVETTCDCKAKDADQTANLVKR